MSPVVWYPGWATDAGVFAPLRRALDAVGADLGPATDFDWAAAESAAQLRASACRVVAQADEPLWLCGWSLGAMLALEAAILHPDAVRGVILLAPTPRFVRDAASGWLGWPVSILARMRTRLAAEPIATLTDFYAACSDPAAPALPGTVLGRGDLENMRSPLDAGLAVLADTDLRPTCPRLRVPALLLAAARDTITPPAMAEWLTAHLPMADLRVWPAGHAFFLEHPAAVATTIGTWLTSQ